MPAQNSTLAALQKDPSVSDVEKSGREFEDCTPCRLMGSAAFTGLGIYTYYSGNKQLREREMEIMQKVHSSGSRFGIGARRFAVFGTSAVLVAMGGYRLVN